MDDGTESALGAVAGCRLRFFASFFSFFTVFISFVFSFFSLFTAPVNPIHPLSIFVSFVFCLCESECGWVYPSQSGMSINPLLRYTSCGLDGMLEGRCSDWAHCLYFAPLFS